MKIKTMLFIVVVGLKRIGNKFCVCESMAIVNAQSGTNASMEKMKLKIRFFPIDVLSNEIANGYILCIFKY